MHTCIQLPLPSPLPLLTIGIHIAPQGAFMIPCQGMDAAGEDAVGMITGKALEIKII